VILLTKAVGTGLISTALKRERASKSSVDAAIASMSQLNRAAAEALHELMGKTKANAVHSVTDVTGFGVLGHAREMALGDPEKGIPEVTIEIEHKAVPVLPGAFDAARQGMIAGGLNNNLDFLRDCVTFASSVPEENRALLFDPQTSGGLLVAISPDAADAAVVTLRRHQVTAAKIGRVLPKGASLLSVT
jgi:selenide,water dikinase